MFDLGKDGILYIDIETPDPDEEVTLNDEETAAESADH